MSDEKRSRPCPKCKSKNTERIGEFGMCLDCEEAFHHSQYDAIDLDAEINEGVGGTDNG